MTREEMMQRAAERAYAMYLDGTKDNPPMTLAEHTEKMDNEEIPWQGGVQMLTKEERIDIAIRAGYATYLKQTNDDPKMTLEEYRKQRKEWEIP